MSEDNSAVCVENMSFAYDGSPVLSNVELRIEQRDFVGIVGPNGGGKTTLLKLLLGLLQPTQGRIRILGVPPAEARRRVGYMPQYAHLDPQFPVTVMDVVLMARLRHWRRIGPYSRTDKEVVTQSLREVGLYDMRKRPFSALSGGQRQRALIARALACEPQLLLLDEPSASLDLLVQNDVYELLRRINAQLTIVLVSHDVGFVSQYVTRVVCVNNRVAVHPTSALTGETVREMYGHDMHIVHHEHHHHADME